MKESDHLQLRIDWEERAVNQGQSLSGVLLKNLPDFLNRYLHEQHINIVKQKLLSQMPQSAIVLDVASGYGRISSDVQTIRPDLELVGLDFVEQYCQAYVKNTESTAVCASLYDLPFIKNFADGIIAITALMYIDGAQQSNVIHHLLKCVNPGGYVLFLDPGIEYLDLISQFRENEQPNTSGKGFAKNEYLRLGQTNISQVIDSGGFPAFSFFLPILYGLARYEKITRKILGFTKLLDRKMGGYRKYSLHRWLLLKRI